MNAELQEKDKENQTISPLAKDMTYGEKAYDFIFNNLINFWVNLTTSAVFSYWLSHSHNPIRLPFSKNPLSPSDIQRSWAKGIHDLPILNTFGAKGDFDLKPKDNMRRSVATTMAGVFTLTTAGHFIMIPSVWLGAKIKAPFVRWLDRKHYGEDAMDDPSLKLRHALVDAEERPTLFGTILGRAGTIVATQFTGYTVGNTNNVFKFLGNKFNIGPLKNFMGLDSLTELLGSKLGGTVTDAFPKSTERMNSFARRHNYTWSNSQEESLERYVAGGGNVPGGGRTPSQIPYGTNLPGNHGGGVTEHMGRYFVADILYSFVTAVSIMPAIHFLKQYVPGMTYKPTVSAETQAIIAGVDTHRLRMKRNPYTEKVEGNDSEPTVSESSSPDAEREPVFAKTPGTQIQSAQLERSQTVAAQEAPAMPEAAR